jgi:hypothetical protein
MDMEVVQGQLITRAASRHGFAPLGRADGWCATCRAGGGGEGKFPPAKIKLSWREQKGGLVHTYLKFKTVPEVGLNNLLLGEFDKTKPAAPNECSFSAKSR